MAQLRRAAQQPIPDENLGGKVSCSFKALSFPHPRQWNSRVSLSVFNLITEEGRAEILSPYKGKGNEIFSKLKTIFTAGSKRQKLKFQLDHRTVP